MLQEELRQGPSQTGQGRGCDDENESGQPASANRGEGGCWGVPDENELSFGGDHEDYADGDCGDDGDEF